jgi:hypothetical protein
MKPIETILTAESSEELISNVMAVAQSTLADVDFSSRLESLDAICTDCCEPGERIEVQTRNSCYEMIVLAGTQVLVRGGRFLSEFRRARLTGSTAGSSALKPKIIQVGLRMELAFDSEIVSTSTVLGLSHTRPDPDLA